MATSPPPQPASRGPLAAVDGIPTGNTYDKYASANPVERRLMKGFFATLDSLVPALPPQRVLEVGVGEGEVTGRLRQRWPQAAFVGVDLPDPELAGEWHERSITAMFGDVVTLPFPDATFDLVLAIEVLEHVPDPDRALRELARVARADVLVSVPREPVWRAANMARGKYLKELGNTPGHIQHWGRRSFARTVARHLEVSSVRSPFPWTMVAATVAR